MQEPVFSFEEPYVDPVAYDAAIKERRNRFFRIGLSLAVLLTSTVIMQYVLMFVIMAIYPAAMSAWWMNWVLSTIPLYGFGLPAFLLSMIGVGKDERNETYISRGHTFRKPRFTFVSFLMLLLIGMGLMYVGSIMSSMLMSALSEATGYDYENALASIVDTSPTWMVFVGTVVVAPIGEELIFRKLLVDRTRGFGDVTAILISAISFGLFHGNFFQFFYAFLLGALLAYVYTWSGNWLWCVGIHAVVNLWGSILMPALTGQFDLEGEIDLAGDPSKILDYVLLLGLEFLILCLIMAAVGLLIYLICMRRIYLGKRQSEMSLSMSVGDRVGATLGNPGMILAMVLFGIYISLSLIPF